MRILVCIVVILIGLLEVTPAEAQRRMFRRKVMKVHPHPIKLNDRKQSKRSIEYFKKNKSTLGTALTDKKEVQARKPVGRNGRQLRLKMLGQDNKQPRYVRGQIKRDLNEIKQGKRNSVRVPVGHDLAHRHNKPAIKGNNYEDSKLQGKDLHKSQHRNEKKQVKQKKAGSAPSSRKRK